MYKICSLTEEPAMHVQYILCGCSWQVGMKGNVKTVNRGLDCDVIVAEVDQTFTSLNCYCLQCFDADDRKGIRPVNNLNNME